MSLDFKRRKFLKISAATMLTSSAGILLLACEGSKKLKNVNLETHSVINPSIRNIKLEHDSSVLDSLQKIKNFNQMFSEDIFLSVKKQFISQATLKRILKVQQIIGYANFNLLSFDNMLVYAHRFSQIGRFTKEELIFIDEIFFYDANKYGFYGNKVIKSLTAKINKKDTLKISGSGHYLFQGEALRKFHKLENDIGTELILTSGVRSVVKQLQLFLSKLNSSKGNLSLASRSLAPPGHSYHGIGDFDVGKKGFGKLNFTSQFSQTNEYKKLIELKYVDLRYTKDNQVGVRYEPWHIKVV